MKQQEYAIIVAGGKGTRIKSLVPKQFIPLAGLPILMHTIEAFREYSQEIKIILVLPQDDVTRWNQLCEQHRFEVPLEIVHGGETRFGADDGRHELC